MPKTDLPDVRPDEIIIAVAENYSGLYKEEPALYIVTHGDSKLLRLFAPSKGGDIRFAVAASAAAWRRHVHMS